MSGTTMRFLTLLAAFFTVIPIAGHGLAATIDPFTTAFPPNPALPLTQPSLLFVGSYCDGAACPPAATVAQTFDSALQTGLPGVLGGNRLSNLNLLLDGVVAQLDPGARRVAFTPPFDGKGILQLRYGTAGKLHANLTADGSTGFVFDIESDASPSILRFVSCLVEVTSHWGEPGEASAILGEAVVSPGPMRFDFSSFTGIDFTQVDELTFEFHETLVAGIPFSIGPIATSGGATPVRASSWGRIKRLYR